MSVSFRDRFSIGTRLEPVTIDGLPTEPSDDDPEKSDAKDELVDELRPRLFDLHELMMANEEHAVLLVLQGLDCSGKGGTVKHVVSAMNPVGVRVSTFREPEGEERQEHFLERIKRALPEPGQLAVFDRSHYEDAIVPEVDEELTDEQLNARLKEIVEFEADLVERNISIVKCYLNISYDEQRERFLRRLRRPDKHWKFSESDLETRAEWPENQVTYGRVIGCTSTDHAPWYAIPGDKKWFRNWSIAHLLIEQFESFGETYPALDVDADAVRARLAPPN